MSHPAANLNLCRRIRPLVEWGVLFVLGALAFGTWYLQGVFSPCRVTSGSMAETLLGDHRDVVCGDCGFPFSCDAATRAVGPRAVCPNCGYAGNDLQPLPDLDGDRVLIDKSAFCLRSPRRWEVVAFASPRDTTKILVKRVVGLPGETVQIRDGDVYVDGEIQRKTLSQQRAMAVLVHDADYPPYRGGVAAPCWRGAKADSQWGSAQGLFVRPDTPDDDSIDWLVYHHRGDAAIGDDCSYNASLSRRIEDTAVVTDVGLSLRLVETFGEGVLLIRAHDGCGEFQVSIDPAENRYRVSYNDRPVPAASGKLPERHDGLRCEVSVFDRQFLLAFDGQTVVAWPYDCSRHTPCAVADGTRSVPATTLAIGAKGLGVAVENLRVYRDVYYTQQGWRGLSKPCRLGADEYFVLGDNSPVSDDSRTWPESLTVNANSLLGKPLVVIFPARRTTWFGRGFQVPDLGKIRYIR